MKMEEVTQAIVEDLLVVHKRNGTEIDGLHLTGVITRYDRRTRTWKYSLELMNAARCLIIASPEDVELDE